MFDTRFFACMLKKTCWCCFFGMPRHWWSIKIELCDRETSLGKAVHGFHSVPLKAWRVLKVHFVHNIRDVHSGSSCYGKKWWFKKWSKELNISQSSMDKLGQIIKQGVSNEKEKSFQVASLCCCESVHMQRWGITVILGLYGYPEWILMNSILIYFLPLCLSTPRSGSGPCLSEAAQPEEQAREQTREHRSEEDTHGTPARGSGTRTGGRILERKRRTRRRCARTGEVG